MTATVTTLRTRVWSTPSRQQHQGEHVQPNPLLDLIETLLHAARHPDITAIERYGPGQGPWGPDVATSKAKAITGIMVRHQSTATASVWEAVWPEGQPVTEPPAWPPPRQNRAPRLLLLISQLLDTAQPEALTSWQLLTLPNLGLTLEQDGLPFGLSVTSTGGQKLLLRATATGPTVGVDPVEEPFPDYQVPEEVKTCLRGSSTPRMSPRLPADAALAQRL